MQTLLLQLWPASQPPQLTVDPQPSGQAPHCFEGGQEALGVQLMQTLLLQLWPASQPPQLTVDPQPSGAMPQFIPGPQLVCGMQAGIKTTDLRASSCRSAEALAA